MLRRKVDRGLAKYRRGVAEAVLCKYRGLLSAKSPEKITPKAQVALATTKTSQLRSSRTSHRSTRPGNEVAGRLRIQIRNYVIFCARGTLNSSIVDRSPADAHPSRLTHNHTYLLAAHSPLLPAALPSHPRREALGSARAPCAVQLHPTRDQRRSTRRLADTPYGIVEVSERPAAAEVAPGGFRCSARAGRTPAMISRACCAFVPLITPTCVPRRAQAVYRRARAADIARWPCAPRATARRGK